MSRLNRHRSAAFCSSQSGGSTSYFSLLTSDAKSHFRCALRLRGDEFDRIRRDRRGGEREIVPARGRKPKRPLSRPKLAQSALHGNAELPAALFTAIPVSSTNTRTV